MQSTKAFQDAIKKLGGPLAAAGKIGKKQPTISGYLKHGNAPADVCMRIEVATRGEYPAESLRPDLTEMFKAFRQSRPGEPEQPSEAA